MRLENLVQQYTGKKDKPKAWGIADIQDDGSYECSIDGEEFTIPNKKALGEHPRDWIIIGNGEGKPPKSL